MMPVPGTSRDLPPAFPGDRMRHILVESSYAAIWRDILDGVTFYIRERHAPWQLSCLNLPEFAAAMKKKPDGALCVLHPEQRALLDVIRATRVPTVNMLRDVHPHLPSVLSDHTAIGAAAAEYFIARGFQHFAFLGPDRDWSNLRRDGFSARLRAAGKTLLDANPQLDVSQYKNLSDKRTLRTLQQWIKPLPKPVALFAAADFVARTALEACLVLRLHVPQQVAILGVDNDLAICELAPVSLSSIPQNLHRIGFESARLLDGLLARRATPRKPLLIPPRDPVIRRSTNFFAFEDPRISTAMRLIHAQPDGAVSLKQVLRQAGVSRQWLDRRFKELLGYTASQEIRRLKLERVRALLFETHLPIHLIATRCGFGQSENLTRFFRDATGISPREFRLQHHSAVPPLPGPLPRLP